MTHCIVSSERKSILVSYLIWYVIVIKASLSVGEGLIPVGNAACSCSGLIKFVQNNLTLCAAEPKSAESINTGAPMNDWTN